MSEKNLIIPGEVVRGVIVIPFTFEGGNPPGEHDVPVVILEGGAIAYWRPDRGGFQLVENDPQWDMLERKVEEQRRENREWAAYMKRMN